MKLVVQLTLIIQSGIIKMGTLTVTKISSGKEINKVYTNTQPKPKENKFDEENLQSMKLTDLRDLVAFEKIDLPPLIKSKSKIIKAILEQTNGNSNPENEDE